jgi:diguanylate cyclase (GGDEF)-like protein
MAAETSICHIPCESAILIAEDSPTQAERLRYLLEEKGYAVTAATNGIEALAAARHRLPHLVISDVMMPEMDGFTLCGEIKRDEKLKDVPFILLTSLSDVADIMKGLECGADNFIRKPYEDRYLLARIEGLLTNHALRKNQKMRMGMEIYLGGQKHFISAERQQIVDLLISVYEDAVHLNRELHARQLELTQSYRQLNGLYRIAESLNRAVSQHEVCEKVLERAVDLPGVAAGWLYLQEDDGFRLAASCNIPPSVLAPETMEKPCECQRLFLAGDLNHVSHVHHCERAGVTKDKAFSVRCHVSVPLWIGNQNRGIMNLAGTKPGGFTESEMQMFYGVGYQASIALERARLHEHMEQRVEQRTAALTAEISRRKQYEARITRLNRLYGVLSGINTTIVRVRATEELFDTACRIAVELGQFAFTWIGLLDAASQRMAAAAQAGDVGDGGDGLSQSNRKNLADLSGNQLIAEAVEQRRPAICNDLVSPENQRPADTAAPSPGYAAMVALPLMVNNQVAGVFVLYAADRDFFDDEEMGLLTEIAGDISFAMDHLKKEERLNYLAFFDAVTGLPNRALFLDRVDQRITASHDDHQVFSVIILDLERFSSINESLGRPAGDSLLCQLGQRLKQALGETDILAHLSADHFAVCIRHKEESTDIFHVLEGMLGAIQRQPFLVEEHELRVSARGGASSFPADGRDTDALLRHAETALRRAKLSCDRYLFYAPEFNSRVTEKLKLETRLRRAIEEEQLILHYQPKIDLESGQISGLEALMRWKDPDNGLVPPLAFIPLLEETRMILEAGSWALSRAISDSARWRAMGLNPPKVAVNVSPVQLRQKNFVSMVAGVIDAAGSIDLVLELEITESVIMQDIEANIEKLKILRGMGIEVAIDDFGTGYSSLSYIAKLPVNVLKIDRAFIINMASNADDFTIVSAIISLAHSLHLRVIAEGVETGEQANMLRGLQCDEIQGYLFSPGVTAEKIEEFLRQKKSLARNGVEPNSIR